jgi:transcriptional regulator with XRE-family HTH domain
MTAKFGARLRELREAAGMTQVGLAAASGIVVRKISRLETGTFSPSWETVQILAKALGKTCQDFEVEPSSIEPQGRGRPPAKATATPAKTPRKRKK